MKLHPLTLTGLMLAVALSATADAPPVPATQGQMLPRTAEALTNPPPSVVQTPHGEFRYLRMTVPDGRRFDLICRGEKVVGCHIFDDPGYPNFEGLKASPERVAGSFTAGGGFPMKYQLSLVIANGQVTGDCEATHISDVPPPKGSNFMVHHKFPAWKSALKGEALSSQQLAKENALTPGRDWPSFCGPNGNYSAAPCDRPLVDDLKEARLVWRSEAITGHGPGTAASSRNLGDYSGSAWTLVGGGVSPIVADGKVFQVYHEGNGDLAILPLEELRPPPAGSWDNFERVHGSFWRQYEQRRHKLAADDVIVAMDAASGRTLWITRFPLRSMNFIDHKNHYCGHTGAVVGKALVAMGAGGNYYGLDIDSGKVLWERADVPGPAGLKRLETLVKGGKIGKFTRAEGANHCVAEGLFIATDYSGGLLALNPATGKTIWHTKGAAGSGNATMLVKLPQGQVLLFNHGIATDAKTGKILWNIHEAACDGHGRRGYAIQGDRVVAMMSKPQSMLVCYRATAEKAEEIWSAPVTFTATPMEIRNNAIYFNDEENILCHSMTDGKRLGALKAQGVGGFSANAGSSISWGDRILCFMDIAHGHAIVNYFQVNGPDMKVLSHGYGAPVLRTGTYNGGFWVPCVVDGRWYLRGADGIYCFDLRKKN